MTTLVIEGGTVVAPTGSARADVLVRDGVVTEVAPRIDRPAAATVLDATGCVVGPGLVDLHAHLREPGDEEAETVETAARAAALGGYTAVVAMPNTRPACDSASVVAQVLELARDAACEVVPAGAITVGRRGETLAPMAEMAALGVTLFTDDGACVQDGDLMRRALEYAGAFGLTCAQHCEDGAIAAGGVMHEGPWSSTLGLAGQPTLAETVVVARDLGLVALTGAPLHLLHLSAPDSVALVAAARARGLPVSCEVAPHHLALDDACCRTYDPTFRVSPPLRPRAHADALGAMLRDGAIDAVATDHAPHPAEAKDQPFAEAAPGMLGLQHAAGITAEALTTDGATDLVALFAVCARHPARIARLRASDRRLGGHTAHGGDVVPGEAANLCVLDLGTPHTVTQGSLASRSRNCPYVGRTLPLSVRHTVLRGEPTVLDGVATR